MQRLRKGLSARKYATNQLQVNLFWHVQLRRGDELMGDSTACWMNLLSLPPIVKGTGAWYRRAGGRNDAKWRTLISVHLAMSVAKSILAAIPLHVKPCGPLRCIDVRASGHAG